MVGMFMNDLVNWLLATKLRFKRRRAYGALAAIGQSDVLDEYAFEWFRQWKRRMRSPPEDVTFYCFSAPVAPADDELTQTNPLMRDVVELILTRLANNNVLCGTLPAIRYVVSNLRCRDLPKTLNGKLRFFGAVSQVTGKFLADPTVRFCGFYGWWNEMSRPAWP
jgi:hypothetical protein